MHPSELHHPRARRHGRRGRPGPPPDLPPRQTSCSYPEGGGPECPPKVYHRVCPPGAVPPTMATAADGSQVAVCPKGSRLANNKFYDLYDQYGNPVVPVEPVRLRHRSVRIAILALYIISLIIMIVDLIINVTEVVAFYILCNAILLFRVFGVYLITRILHVLLIVVILILFAIIDWENTNFFNAMTALIPLIIVLCISCHMMLFRPGRTSEERANRASYHAVMGLLIAVLFFWIMCFLVNFHNLQCILEMLYFLLFLIIVLTPHFQTKSHAATKARKELEYHFPECKPNYEPCPSPSCCVAMKPCRAPFSCPNSPRKSGEPIDDDFDRDQDRSTRSRERTNGSRGRSYSERDRDPDGRRDRDRGGRNRDRSDGMRDRGGGTRERTDDARTQERRSASETSIFQCAPNRYQDAPAVPAVPACACTTRQYPTRTRRRSR